ncbi:hypothetical protein ACLOJK_026757 [Asimina triloba]
MDFYSVQIPEEIAEQVDVRPPPLMVTDDMKRTLYYLATWREWREVVEKCERWPFILCEKITGSQETIFHMAVGDEQPWILEELVEMVSDGKMLEIADEKGNTPLHLAASMGKTRMANCLVSKHRELIKICNKDNQTPLFVAAVSGNKNTFLYLLAQCSHGFEDIAYWRGKGGNSILHAAISEEYFGII